MNAYFQNKGCIFLFCACEKNLIGALPTVAVVKTNVVGIVCGTKSPWTLLEINEMTLSFYHKCHKRAKSKDVCTVKAMARATCSFNKKTTSIIFHTAVVCCDL